MYIFWFANAFVFHEHYGVIGHASILFDGLDSLAGINLHKTIENIN